jgi:hypothetical protein
VYVSSSRLPQGGEGLFARRDIRKREVIALYNGIKVCTVGMPHGLYESFKPTTRIFVDAIIHE